MTKRLRVKRKDLQVIDDFIVARKKIHAIKHARQLTGASLRHAKLAVDHRTHVLSGNQTASEAILYAPWVVKSLTTISPDGEQIEVNVKELELKFLQEGTRISMDEVAALLDLTQFIKNWQEGAYVTSEEEKSDI
tara:strand:+ start:2543 stop:2947 length:405 start_codon:yes stop_codon:yes gene_type:complete